MEVCIRLPNSVGKLFRCPPFGLTRHTRGERSEPGEYCCHSKNNFVVGHGGMTGINETKFAGSSIFGKRWVG